MSRRQSRLSITAEDFAAKVEAEAQFAVDDFRLCPEGATSSSPGLLLRLPWGRSRKGFNRNAVAKTPIKNAVQRRNRVAVETQIGRLPRVAQSGNPGLEDGAPSGQP